jgi:hypothetical protein
VARPLKHLKHETSTKRQCAATVRLQGRAAWTSAAHKGLAPETRFGFYSEFAKERAKWASLSWDFDPLVFVLVRVERVVIPHPAERQEGW